MKSIILAIASLVLISTLLTAHGWPTVSGFIMTCRPQPSNPPEGAVSIFVECASGRLWATAHDGNIYNLTQPIRLRASVNHMCLRGIGYIPDGWSGSEWVPIESYIRIPIDWDGDMKNFRLAVFENNESGSVVVRIRVNGATVYDTLTNGPAEITIPPGFLGSQQLSCCRNGQTNININRGDQVYWQIDTRQSNSGCIGFHTTVAS